MKIKLKFKLNEALYFYFFGSRHTAPTSDVKQKVVQDQRLLFNVLNAFLSLPRFYVFNVFTFFYLERFFYIYDRQIGCVTTHR